MRRSVALAFVVCVALGSSAVGSAQNSVRRALDEQAAIDACLASGDSECVVRLLGGGRARSTSELRALFIAYRTREDVAGLCDTIERMLAGSSPTRFEREQLEEIHRGMCLHRGG